MPNLPVFERWVIIPKRNPVARAKLFCFPYAGATAWIFRSWPANLPQDVEVCAIQLPGRSNRIGEPLCTSLTQLAEEVAAALVPSLDRPFAFFGHSFGALLAFQAAVELNRRWQLPPALLMVSGRRAPHIVEERKPWREMDDEELLTRITAYNGMPAEVLADPELIALVLPALRADLEIADTYESHTANTLPCPITAFAGAADDEHVDGKTDAWVKHTSNRFVSHTLPGDHFFIHSCQDELLRLIRSELRGYCGTAAHPAG